MTAKPPVWDRFKTHLFSGLLVLAPLFLTFLVLGYLVRLADGFIVNPLFRLLPIQLDQTFEIVFTKLAIAFVVMLFTILVGILAEKFIIRRMFVVGEELLKGIPVFNKVYGSIREIADAFFGDKRGVFRRVVFIEYPRKGIYALGFVTQDKRWEIHERTGKDVFTVFIPSPPNPATGFFIFVPREEMINADMTVEEGIKTVISGGCVVPPPRISSKPIA